MFSLTKTKSDRKKECRSILRHGRSVLAGRPVLIFATRPAVPRLLPRLLAAERLPGKKRLIRPYFLSSPATFLTRILLLPSGRRCRSIRSLAVLLPFKFRR